MSNGIFLALTLIFDGLLDNSAHLVFLDYMAQRWRDGHMLHYKGSTLIIRLSLPVRTNGMDFCCSSLPSQCRILLYFGLGRKIRFSQGNLFPWWEYILIYRLIPPMV